MTQNAIVARFLEEFGNIGAYLHSLRGHSCLYTRELERLNDALIEVDLQPLQFPTKTSKEQRLSLDETHGLTDQLQTAFDRASRLMAVEVDTAREEPSFPESGPAVRYELEFDSVLGKMMKRLPPNADADEIDRSFHAEFLTATAGKTPP